MAHLTDLLQGKGRGTQPITWTPLAQAAFEDLRTAHCTNMDLNAPLPQRLFLLYTDASDEGLGAVLTQQTPPRRAACFLAEP